MARALRIEYEGAVYHVMARGNHGQPIYADDGDRRVWLETLGEACEKTGWLIHAYVMMDNHYHLLLETPEGNLVRTMKWFQGTYTQRYNARHEVFGHLFQGRYKALVVDGESGYFEVVSTYIHLNPVRAGLIRPGKDSLAEYRWSSYPLYLKGRTQRPVWLETKRVMGNLALDQRDWKGYEAYMEGRVLELGMQSGRQALESQWRQIRRGWYLGGEGFKGRLVKMLRAAIGNRRSSSHAGEAKKAHGEDEAEGWLAVGLKILGLAHDSLRTHPKGMKEKMVLAWWLRGRTIVGREWIAERLWIGDPSRVSKGIQIVKQGADGRVNALKRRLVRELERQTKAR